jgi:putative heme iron utilization protein
MAIASDDDDRTVGRAARGLIRRATKAALATLGSPRHPDTLGWPANALVTVASAADGSPLLLLSTLAHHTQNILADSRASLLIDATDGFANPQAGPRITVMGRIVRTEDASHARRFLARHAAARAYAGFGDFAFYRLDIARVHSVGGFARARWIEASDVTLPEDACHEIAAHEDDILVHMNGDHAETLLLYAQRVLKSRTTKARLIAVDPDGFDLACGRHVRRVEFPHVVSTLDEMRAAFVDLARRARGFVN